MRCAVFALILFACKFQGAPVDSQEDPTVDAAQTIDSSPPVDGAVIADAAELPLVPGEGCGQTTATPISIGQELMIASTTAGATDDGSVTCNGESHPDHIYELAVDADMLLTVTLTVSGWNPALQIRRNNCVSGTTMGCSQNSDTLIRSLAVFAGDAVFIRIDGGNAGAGSQDGDYTLVVAAD